MDEYTDEEIIDDFRGWFYTVNELLILLDPYHMHQHQLDIETSLFSITLSNCSNQ